MKLGYFAMPAHPPERDLRQGFEWDLEVIRWLDELGYAEAWVGEHHTVPWEPNPAPDLLLARAFAETRDIRLGPGGFLLPFHHPAALASRLVHAGPPVGRPAELRRRGELDPRPTRPCSASTRRPTREHDPGVAGDHPEALERGRGRSPTRASTGRCPGPSRVGGIFTPT